MKPKSIWLKFIQLLLASGLLAFASAARAAVSYSCNISALPINYSQTYSGSSNSSTSLSLSVSCTKSGSGSGLTINYTVTPNNGLNASGSQNRASLSGNLINYDLYTDATCTTPWSGSGSMVFGGGAGSTITQTLTYYGTVPAAQPSLPPLGTYSDSVNMTLATTTGGVTITGTNPAPFLVSIVVPAACTISTQPGNITFSYTSFGAGANASTTFATICTNQLPYTMAIDATSGTIAGVNYSLALSAAGGTGTGLAQTYTINGTIAAGQAGTCAAATCSGSQARYLTITY